MSFKPAIPSEIERRMVNAAMHHRSYGHGQSRFDTLFGRVVANMPETWIVFARSGASGSPEVGA